MNGKRRQNKLEVSIKNGKEFRAICHGFVEILSSSDVRELKSFDGSFVDG